MLSMFKKKPDNYGPFTISAYPRGFNPLFPQTSLQTALDVVDNIRSRLKETVDSFSETLTPDEEQCKTLFNRIESLVGSINNLREYLSTTSLIELQKDSSDAIEQLNIILDAAEFIVNNLTAQGPKSLFAINLFADMLQIIRRGMPDIELVTNQKSRVESIRNNLIVVRNNGISHEVSSIKVGAETSSRKSTIQPDNLNEPNSSAMNIPK